MNRFVFALCVLVLVQCLGCGPSGTVMPPGQFTEEQKAKAAAEYKNVHDEESMNSRQDNRKKK